MARAKSNRRRPELRWLYFSIGSIRALVLVRDQPHQPTYLVVGREPWTRGVQGNWYVPDHLDVGTGESDLTWQGMVGMAYAFDSLDVIAA